MRVILFFAPYEYTVISVICSFITGFNQDLLKKYCQFRGIKSQVQGRSLSCSCINKSLNKIFVSAEITLLENKILNNSFKVINNLMLGQIFT